MSPTEPDQRADGFVAASVGLRTVASLVDAVCFAAWMFTVWGVAQWLTDGMIPIWQKITVALLAAFLFAAATSLFRSISGQTIGSALVGLRVVTRAENRAAGFGSTLLRSMLFGLSCMSVLLGPIVLWVQCRTHPTQAGWVHEISRTWVADIRRGRDPFRTYVVVEKTAEEWAKEAEPAGLLSILNRSHVHGDTLPSAVTVVQLADRQPHSLNSEALQDGNNVVPRTLAVASMVSTTSILLAGTAAVALVLANPWLAPGEPFKRQQYELAQSKSSAVPGFNQEPIWQRQVAASASVFGFDTGIAVIDDGVMSIHSSEDGAVYASFPAVDVQYVTETQVEGSSAIAWYGGSNLSVWVPRLTGQQALSYPLEPNAIVTSAGNSLLIKQNDQYFTPSVAGLLPVQVPDGHRAFGIESHQLLSTAPDGPLTITDLKNSKASTLTLVAPSSATSLSRWVTAGNGLVVTVWNQDPVGLSTQPLSIIAVNSLTDGSLLSETETTPDRLEKESWQRGQGNSVASFANFLFDANTGELIEDFVSYQIVVSNLMGRVVIGEKNGESVLEHDNKIFVTNAKPAGAFSDGSVLFRGEGESIQRLAPTKNY